MGERGSKKRPTNLALLHGERSDRINHDEPQAPDGLPEPNDGMDPETREIWDYTIAQLRVMRLATPADRDALIAYCEAVVVHRKASQLVHRTGLMVRGRRPGEVVRNPAVQMMRDSAMMIRILGREFGLTPSARSDIHMNAGRAGAADGNPDRLLS